MHPLTRRDEWGGGRMRGQECGQRLVRHAGDAQARAAGLAEGTDSLIPLEAAVCYTAHGQEKSGRAQGLVSRCPGQCFWGEP